MREASLRPPRRRFRPLLRPLVAVAVTVAWAAAAMAATTVVADSVARGRAAAAGLGPGGAARAVHGSLVQVSGGSGAGEQREQQQGGGNRGRGSDAALLSTPKERRLPSCVDYTVSLSDSCGDGWGDNTLYIGSSYEVTLTDSCSGTCCGASSATSTVCLAPGTYTPFACGGTYPEEVSWVVGGLNGGAVASCTGATGTAGSFTVTLPTPTPCEHHTVSMTDSYGDGWAGTILYIGSQEFTLSSGSSGTASVCLAAGIYTPFACGGIDLDEVGWSVGGVDGGVSCTGGSCADDEATSSCSGSASFTVTLSTTQNPTMTPTMTPTTSSPTMLPPTPLPTVVRRPDHEFDFRGCSLSTEPLSDTYDSSITFSPRNGAACSAEGMVLDGVDDFVNVTTWAFGGEPMTVEAYVKVDALTNAPIFAFGDDPAADNVVLSGTTTGQVLLTVYDRSTSAAAALVSNINYFETDTWVHVVVTIDGTDRQLYRDGVNINWVAVQGTAVMSTSLTRSEHWIGRALSGSDYLDGTIAYLRFWHGVALDADQISELYAAVPTLVPSRVPSMQPTSLPTSLPTTTQPTSLPSLAPSARPTTMPSRGPSPQPTLLPTSLATTTQPTSLPSLAPSARPTTMPSRGPSPQPTSLPTSLPTMQPTLLPSPAPSGRPTTEPSVVPIPQPSSLPTALPSLAPTLRPTAQPSPEPTLQPTALPTVRPSPPPSLPPTLEPSSLPTARPTQRVYLPRTIQDIQNVSHEAHNTVENDCFASPLAGMNVRVTGVVTAVIRHGHGHGFYMQDGNGEWSGIQVDTRLCEFDFDCNGNGELKEPYWNINLNVAAQVEVFGTVVELNGTTHIGSVSQVRQIANVSIPAPREIRTGVLGRNCSSASEPYEGMLVRVVNATVISDVDEHNQIALNDGSGTSELEDGVYDAADHLTDVYGSSMVGATLLFVQGVVEWRGTLQAGNWEIHPRTERDVFGFTFMPSPVPTTTAPSVSPAPTLGPSDLPTLVPSNVPSILPTSAPSSSPTSLPSTLPSLAPTELPTTVPSLTPTSHPTALPTTGPSNLPTAVPTIEPSPGPTALPSAPPSHVPTAGPTLGPSLVPSRNPTALPSLAPSLQPTTLPTSAPTLVPTELPTLVPTLQPTYYPTEAPTFEPTAAPSFLPTYAPTTLPTPEPTGMPSQFPTMMPTEVPTSAPTAIPTLVPTLEPSLSPTGQPSLEPTTLPTPDPTSQPTLEPTAMPSLLPTLEPSLSPTGQPSLKPTTLPSLDPTLEPTALPSLDPTLEPTSLPSLGPTLVPTLEPSALPTMAPSLVPSPLPTLEPTSLPTAVPTDVPSPLPTTSRPTVGKHQPTSLPTLGAPEVEGLQVTTPGTIEAKHYTIFNPSVKITILAKWSSSDSSTTLEWSSDDLTLLYGDTTATSLAGNYLVISPSSSTSGAATFEGGALYTLRFQATNSFGRYDYDTISLKAASLPAGGNFTVLPKNGTAMTSPFTLTAAGWTSDAEVLPLSYAYAYTSPATGGRTVLRKASRSTNITSKLPVGDSDSSYELAVAVRIADQIGAYSDVGESVTVHSPPMSQSNSIVTSVLASVDTSTMSSDDVVDIASSLASAASLLNHVLASSSDDATTAETTTTTGSESSSSSDNDNTAAAAEAAILRESLVTAMSKVVTVVADADGVDSSLSTLQVVTSASPTSLSTDTQVKVLGCVGDLMDTSMSLGGTSDDAAQSSMSTLSNLFEGGLLTTSINPSSVPTPLPTFIPTALPTRLPTISSSPTVQPTPDPSSVPSRVPTPAPSLMPTLVPSKFPTLEPSPAPSITPDPTPIPSLVPSPLPTLLPSSLPTLLPSLEPSHLPTLQPSTPPTLLPTLAPTFQPSQDPSPLPTATPLPSALPSMLPSVQPSLAPSPLPTSTFAPTAPPSSLPSSRPTGSMLPTLLPTLTPTRSPSPGPTASPLPSRMPSPFPSPLPSLQPSSPPSSLQPSMLPSMASTPVPTMGPTPLPTAAPHAARRLQERRQRRRLLTTTAEMVDDALMAMNGAIGQSLVAGENKDFTSTHLGVRTAVIDSALLALQGSTGLSVETVVASTSGLPGGFQPQMLLPSTINVSSGVTVAAINYGKFNPYELVGGKLADGASVNAFSFNGVEVSGLEDPIVLALPLPSSRRRLMQEEQGRRALLSSSWNGTWGKKDIAASYSVNCGAANVSRLEATYTTQELARAQFCGTESLLENQTKMVTYFEPWINASKHVWCNSTQEWHYMDCEGRVGIINFTCPVLYPASSCTFWDTTSMTWSSEGCTYWRTDEEMGVAYCNCTHLTSFSSDYTKDLQSSATTLQRTMVRSTSLSGKDVEKNIGVLVFILVIWACGTVLYVGDMLVYRLKLMNENISEDGFRTFLMVRAAFHPEYEAGHRQISNFAEQLRVHETPSAGMLYSTEVENRKAQEDIEYEARALMFRLKNKRMIYQNWKEKLFLDHDVVALINPTSYQRDIFAKRTIIALFNLLSLLFLMCLFTPTSNMEGFVCPDDETPGAGGAGLLPPFPAGMSIAEAFMWGLLKGSKVITNLLWLIPPRIVLKKLLKHWADIHTTKRMHERRLEEIRDRHRLLNPMELKDQIDVYVTLNLLKSMKSVLERLSTVLAWRTTYLEMPQWRRDFLERYFGITIPSHRQLEDHWSEMTGFDKLIDQSIFEANSQIEYLDGEKAGEGENPSASPPARQRAAARFKGRRGERQRVSEIFSEAMERDERRKATQKTKIGKEELKARWAAASEASFPRDVQINIIRHRKMVEAFERSTDAHLPDWVPDFLRRVVYRAKQFCCRAVDPDEGQGGYKPIEVLLIRKSRLLKVVVLYLVLSSFVVFMTGVRLDDNETSKMVLISTFVSEATSKFLAQPVTFFIVAGLWPAVAVSLFIKDVHFFLGNEGRRAAEVRRLGGRLGGRESQPFDPNDPFERSREWMQIESHSAFEGGNRSQAQAPLRTHRVGGTIIGGRPIGGERITWTLFNGLHRHGISTLAELKDPSVVSREFLGGALGLTSEQVAAFWGIMHGIPAVATTPVQVSLRSRLPFSIVGMARPAGSGPSSPVSSRKVMPLLPGELDGHVGPLGLTDSGDTAAGTVQNWLDTIEPGLGERFGSTFTDRGCTTVDDLANLDSEQLAILDSVLAEHPGSTVPTRRRIRAGLRSFQHVVGDVEEQATEVAEPKEVLEAEVAAQDKQASRNGSGGRGSDVEERRGGEEDSRTIEQWLDSIKRGYGERFGHLFKEHGCDHVSQMAHLTERELERIDDALRSIPEILMSTKRRVRGAIRGHWEVIGRVKKKTVGFVERRDEAPPPPQAQEQQQEVEEKPGQGGEEDSRTIEQWLDSIKRGYGERFGHLFKEHGCGHVRQMAHLTERELERIDDALRSIPGILMSTKRRVRGAIRGHWKKIGRVKERPLSLKAGEVREAKGVDSSD